jgi:PEP-CTERM motif
MQSRMICLGLSPLSRKQKACGILFLAAITAGIGRASTCTGNCGTDTANGDVTNPPGFSSYFYVSTTGAPTGGGTLPSVFGATGVTSTNGSTYTTSAFTATAGEFVNFEFNYVTSDGSGYPDYAWAALMSTTGGTDYLIFSAQTQPIGNTVPGQTLPALAIGTSLSPSTSPIMAGSGSTGGPVWAELGTWSGDCYAAGCGLTGWIQSNFNGEAAGNYVLEFGVSNTNDEEFDSGLAFAGVEVGGVSITSTTPEPSSFGFLAAGIGALALAARLRKRTAA